MEALEPGRGGVGDGGGGAQNPEALKPCNPVTLKPCNPETLKPWNPGTLKPWNPETLEPWNPGTLEPWNPETLEPWNPEPSSVTPSPLKPQHTVPAIILHALPAPP